MLLPRRRWYIVSSIPGFRVSDPRPRRRWWCGGGGYPRLLICPTSYRPTWETGPVHSSSIRIRATAEEVTGWRFSFPSWDPPNFLIWLGNAPETYHHRFANVLMFNGPQYYYCSSQIQPDDTDTCGLYCLYYFKRGHRGMDLPDIVKYFSIVYLKGNEDTILRSNLTLYIVMHCNCRYDRIYWT
jgi:hypothetical protein